MTGVETAIIIAAVASTAAAAAGTIIASENAANAAEFNADLAERDAQLARQVAAREEEERRRDARRLIGAQRAAAAASGILPDQGSPLEVLSETAEDAELDALGIRFSGSVAEAQQRSEAARQRFAADIARNEGRVKAGTQLLSGTGSTLNTSRRLGVV